MTPQEKALQLIDSFDEYAESRISDNGRGFDKRYCCKQCALIAVGEIIKSRKDDIAFNDTMWGNASEYYTPHPMYLNYWNLVKQEIEKL